jgi:hypothetical protein
MDRVVISKRVLDRLIRAKLMQLDDCVEVQPLPVVAAPRNGAGCNWTIPGWTGDLGTVGHCTARMQAYLEFLRGQFDITADT